MNGNKIIKIYKETFKANVYTVKPFRMIGTIDVDIKFDYGVEKVTLMYFRSSGTNSGKIKGLWYPTVGIKLFDGEFLEFTSLINNIIKNTTKKGKAKKGWIVKSLYFARFNEETEGIKGFSKGIYYEDLLLLGETLRELYEDGKYSLVNNLIPLILNKTVISNEVYDGNSRTQRENYEKYISEVYIGDFIYKKH